MVQCYLNTIFRKWTHKQSNLEEKRGEKNWLMEMAGGGVWVEVNTI